MTNDIYKMRVGGERKRGRGFTLIEILVVISIIVILVATVLAIGTNVRANAQIRETKLTLSTLQAALNKYMEDGNRQPNDNNDNDYVTKFRSVPEVWKTCDKLKVVTSGSNLVINDGFGVAIKYYTGNSSSSSAIKNQGDKNGFFVSNGPDGSAGTTDDIYSFDPS